MLITKIQSREKPTCMIMFGRFLCPPLLEILLELEVEVVVVVVVEESVEKSLFSYERLCIETLNAEAPRLKLN